MGNLLKELSPLGYPLYNLEIMTEVGPNIYYWKDGKYIIVQNGEHYLLSRDKYDKEVALSRGKLEFVARDYRPRKRKDKTKPRAPRAPRKKLNDPLVAGNPNAIKSTPTWIHPDYIDPDDPYEYTERGFRKGLKPWALKEQKIEKKPAKKVMKKKASKKKAMKKKSPIRGRQYKDDSWNRLKNM